MGKVDTREQLARLMAPIDADSDTTHLLGLIMDKATQVLQADRSTLFLLDEKSDQLWSKIAQGLTITEIRMPRNVGIAGQAAATGETLNLPNAYSSPYFDAEWDRRTGYVTRSVLCMPLFDPRGAIVGVIEVLNKLEGDGVFSKDDEQMLSALCTQAARLIVASNAERA